MKVLIKPYIAISLGLLLTACTIGNGRICGPQTPVAYCDRAAYEKLAHPKAYGQYWVKPGMSVEGWRQDWVRCGGMSNGQYSGNAPTGATTKTILASQEQERKKLDACMKSEGYEYRNTGP